jgi:DNA-binding LacI/PurR family transcriptional regulator
MTATLKDISDKANVSQMTASRALRGASGVSVTTRKRIREIAIELGYRKLNQILMPSSLAATGRDASMRLMIPQGMDVASSNENTNQVADGIASRLEGPGSRVELVGVSDLDDLLRQCRSFKPDGLVLREPFPVDWINQLAEFYPLVSASAVNLLSAVDCVYFDENRAAAAIQQHLAELGHQEIVWFGLNDIFTEENPHGFLKQTSRMDCFVGTNSPRYLAWSMFCVCHPQLYRQTLLLPERDWRYQTLEEAISLGVDELLARRPQPTAIVVATFAMFREVMKQLHDRGLRVPQDMSVVGYGLEHESLQWAEGVDPTYVQLPMRRVGQVVPELVARRIADPDAEIVNMQIQCKFIAGRTTGPVPVPLYLRARKRN